MDTYRIKSYIKNLREKDALVSLSAGFIAVLAMIALLVFVRSIRQKPVAETTPSPSPSPIWVSALPEKVTYIEENGQQIPDGLPVVYQVQPGDSTWKVAQAFYGSGHNYVDIEQANQLTADQGLEVGQQLLIPKVAARVTPAATAVEASPSTSLTASPSAIPTLHQSNNNAEVAARTYVVKPGDSLWKIADQELGSGYRWVEIYRINTSIVGANPDLIYPDQKFELPQS